MSHSSQWQPSFQSTTLESSWLLYLKHNIWSINKSSKLSPFSTDPESAFISPVPLLNFSCWSPSCHLWILQYPCTCSFCSLPWLFLAFLKNKNISHKTSLIISGLKNPPGNAHFILKSSHLLKPTWTYMILGPYNFSNLTSYDCSPCSLCSSHTDL